MSTEIRGYARGMHAPRRICADNKSKSMITSTVLPVMVAGLFMIVGGGGGVGGGIRLRL